MKRYVSLDGLRGLAAIIVVLYHVSMTLPGLTDALNGTIILSPLFAGESAVYLFFVLSGFVLYLSFVHKDNFSSIHFIVKRILRIYPPVFATIAIAFSCLWVFRSRTVVGVSPWFFWSWSQPPSILLLASHISLSAKMFTLDLALWSLAVEMEMSLIFPIIAIGVRRGWPFFLAVSFLISLLCRIYTGRHGILWPAHPAFAAKYLFLFVAGATLAHNQTRLAVILSSIPRYLQIALMIGTICLMTVSPDHFGGLPTTFGAIGLILLVGHAEAISGFFSIAPLRYAGEISYSLYLIHLVVLLSAVYAGTSLLGLKWSLVIGLAACIPATLLLNRLVERPSIYLGRYVAAVMARYGHTAR